MQRILAGRPVKRARTRDHLVPIIFATIRERRGRAKGKTIKVLLDSGASSSLVNADKVAKLKVKRSTPAQWNTAAGSFSTIARCALEFALPELSPSKVVKASVHVTQQRLGNYDMILGRDLLEELGLQMNFAEHTIRWGDGEIPMKPTDATSETSFFVNDPSSISDEAERMSRILDAKYAKADLDEVVNSCTHLSNQEQTALRDLLREFEPLFDGTLGHWQGPDYQVELKADASPYHARPFPIPRAYEKTLRMEVERLIRVGVLKKVNRSEWAAPTFIIPKKDKTVRFISDFRELNKRIIRKPFPIPKIQDLLLKLEGFRYGTALDLNMGYYHIELSPDSKRLCTIVLPWGKYEYQKLPMGLCNSPDIFQEKMSTLMADLEYVRAYIDDLLVLTSSSWTDHLDKLRTVLQRLQDAGLKVNAKKSFFGRAELEYLGHWITRAGIKPVSKKVEAIGQIAPPTTKRQLRSFIGMVNYYRDMWIRRSHVLAPLTKLVSKEAKWQWGHEQQKAFETIKKIVSREVLLAYPNFDRPFDIHTDASHEQLGAVISQDGKPIAFYSRKLSDAQTRYTTTERELLAIVETLKEFRNILLGQQLRVYTDHKNLTYKTFNTERVMRWRLLIEEYNPELHYVKGEKNIVADALSRLALVNMPESPGTVDCDVVVKQPRAPSATYLTDLFAHAPDEPSDRFPLTFKDIQRVQQKDTALLAKLRRPQSPYSLKAFRGGGKERQLICQGNQIVIPSKLQRRVVEWYHEVLCHPGATRTELTIKQHLTWRGMRKTIEAVCGRCPTCQLTKKHTIKYGHLPPKQAEVHPWETLCVDMIGPYRIERPGKKDLELWCVTMIDPATGWFEIVQVPGTKRADVVANLVEKQWLCRYPWPTQLVIDRGTEFMAEFAEMIVNDYGIKKKPITTRNPQANAILERIHQTIGNMLRTLRVQEAEVDEEDPWSGILSAIAFATRATIHTTSRATPMQLVFGRDAIFNVKHLANWKYIQDRKQALINLNNKKENSSRRPHQYQVGARVIVKDAQRLKYGSDAYHGPYPITEVRDNGTVRIQMGAVSDTYNIRNIHPYK